MPFASEIDLYAPVKAFLERQGYAVKGEVRGCDVVATRDGGPPVIVELKLRFGLDLVLQGIDRLALTDLVYLAVPQPSRRRRGRASPDDRRVRKLCRRLGLGLLTVAPGRTGKGRVEVLLDPLPYRPRKNGRRVDALLGEFARRNGDPNRGGSTRRPIVTAYRQEALRCAAALAEAGALSVAALRERAAAPAAASILQRNVYGWFARVARGSYALTESGRHGLATFAAAAA